MKALISYSKNEINYNGTHIEIEFGYEGDTKTFSDEYGTHRVRLLKVSEQQNGGNRLIGIYRIEFANGNVYQSTCVVTK